MGKASLGKHFPDDTTVGAYPRRGPFFPGVRALGEPAARVKVKPGAWSIDLDGLENGDYWLADVSGDVARGVAFTVKDAPVQRVRTEAPTRANPETHPKVSSQVIITGAVGTKVSGQLVHQPVPEGVEPHPSLNQASVRADTPQRSATPVGQATPASAGEPQPHPRQEDVRAGAPQRSATVTGEAEPAPGVVVDRPLRQDEVDGPQRSATELGEATPVGSAEPRGTDVNPDSRERARGVRPTDDGEATKPKRPARSSAKK